jgi:hypothetical protein
MRPQLARLEGAGSPFEWPLDTFGHGRQPFAAFPAGPGGISVGQNGLVIGCFAWVDPASLEASNQQISGGALGLVLPVPGVMAPWKWDRAFVLPPPEACLPPGLSPGGYSPPLQPQANPALYPQIVLRPGTSCVIATAGDFRVRFPVGAVAGSRVWTDPQSGLPYDSDLGGFIETPWTVMQSGGAGARLRISSSVPLS